MLEQGLVKGNPAIAELLLADNFIDHNPLPGLLPNREGFKQSFDVFRTAFPDFTYKIEDIIAEDDKVVVRFSARGTHEGVLAGIPPPVIAYRSLGWISSVLREERLLNSGLVGIN